jgi:hypothetical protein
MSTRDIQEPVKNLYNIDIFLALISKISEKIMPQVDWQRRPLEAYYPFISRIQYMIKFEIIIKLYPKQHMLFWELTMKDRLYGIT